MKYVEVTADAGSTDTIKAIALKVKASDFRLGVVGEDGMRQSRLLVDDDRLQSVLDTLQNVLGAQTSARIVVLNVEASLPKTDENKAEPERSVSAAREAIYEAVKNSARLDLNYAFLVMLSTIVSAIGLIENNVAVVIGAMVIAPLLGPNLALSLATALGDIPLVQRAVKTLLAGILLALVLSAVIGAFWSDPLTSPELISRTDAGLDSIALALASGAAAALSLTTGLSTTLVGVMVAVALLPPTVTLGIMLGQGNIALAIGAGLLLAVNIVCVNLASKIVFFIKGMRPRTWMEKEQANRAMTVYVIGWLVSLIVLILVIFARRSLSA